MWWLSDRYLRLFSLINGGYPPLKWWTSPLEMVVRAWVVVGSHFVGMVAGGNLGLHGEENQPGGVCRS